MSGTFDDAQGRIALSVLFLSIAGSPESTTSDTALKFFFSKFVDIILWIRSVVLLICGQFLLVSAPSVWRSQHMQRSIAGTVWWWKLSRIIYNNKGVKPIVCRAAPSVLPGYWRAREFRVQRQWVGACCKIQGLVGHGLWWQGSKHELCQHSHAHPAADCPATCTSSTFTVGHYSNCCCSHCCCRPFHHCSYCCCRLLHRCSLWGAP